MAEVVGTAATLFLRPERRVCPESEELVSSLRKDASVRSDEDTCRPMSCVTGMGVVAYSPGREGNRITWDSGGIGVEAGAADGSTEATSVRFTAVGCGLLSGAAGVVARRVSEASGGSSTTCDRGGMGEELGKLMLGAGAGKSGRSTAPNCDDENGPPLLGVADTGNREDSDRSEVRDPTRCSGAI